MFYAKENGKLNGTDQLTTRAREAGTAAARAASTATQTAAQGVSNAAQTAAQGVSKGVGRGVYSARGWAAPQLENAADYFTATMAPRVSSALRTTAQQVRPEDMRTKKGSPLAWSLLAAAAVAAAGAAAGMIWHRYRSAMAADTAEDTETSTGSDAAPPAGTDSAGGKDAGVNGRVSASGW